MVIVSGIDSVEAHNKATEMLKRIPTPDEITEDLVVKGEGELIDPDTEFTYPSGHKRRGFYMDKTLKTNLDNFLIPAVHAKWDGVGLVTGMEGCFTETEGSSILMANGEWKKVSEIKKGDMVLSPQYDGSNKFSKVLETYKWMSVENYDIKEITGAKRVLFRCASNHGLPINVKKNGKWEIQPIAADYYSKRKTIQNESMLTTFPIQSFIGKENCKVEPYTLGFFIGDGSFIGKNLRLTNSFNDKASMNYIKKIHKPSSSCDDKRAKNIVTTYYYGKGTKLWNQLESIGLKDKRSDVKFIPKEALTSDINYRINLLSGLIDADGSIYKNTYSIKTKSKQLAEDIKDLVYSLGGKARINVDDWAIKNIKNSNRYYRISFHISTIDLQVKVKRKIKNKDAFYDSNKVKIRAERVKSEPEFVYGINIDSPSHMLITREWCVSYNSAKSTNVMSIAKYLDPTFPGELVGDGTTRRRCDRVVFSAGQFTDAIDAAKPRQAIVFDEAVMGFLAADASTEIQRALIKKMVTIRKKQLYIFVVLPSIFLLRMYMAIFRTRFMLHYYTPDGISRGYFKFYSYETKRRLYITGKRDFNQDAAKYDFAGRATDTSGLFFPIDEYEDKKDAAIQSIVAEPERKKEDTKNAQYLLKGQRDVMVWGLYKDQKRLNQNLTFENFAEWLATKYGETMRNTGEGVRKMINNAQRFLEKPDPIQNKKDEYIEKLKTKLS
jgi:hypothetical protein